MIILSEHKGFFLCLTILCDINTLVAAINDF